MRTWGLFNEVFAHTGVTVCTGRNFCKYMRTKHAVLISPILGWCCCTVSGLIAGFLSLASILLFSQVSLTDLNILCDWAIRIVLLGNSMNYSHQRVIQCFKLNAKSSETDSFVFSVAHAHIATRLQSCQPFAPMVSANRTGNTL